MPRTRSRTSPPKAESKSSPENDPRTKRSACVKVPSGDRAFVEGVDPKDSGRVLITYEAGLGSDSYPLHMLTLVQESAEPPSKKKPTPRFAVGEFAKLKRSISPVLAGTIVQITARERKQGDYRYEIMNGRKIWCYESDLEPLVESSAPIAPTVISEADQLAALEQKIQHGIDQIESGKAIIWEAVAEVQQRQLWKVSGYSSFEDYCKRRWGWEKSNGFEVAAAGRIMGELKESGVPESALPTSVAQTRQIAKVPREKRAEVVQKIAESGEKLTAKAIKQAVEPTFEQTYLAEAVCAVAETTPAQPLQTISPDQRVAEKLIVEYNTSILEVAKRLLHWCNDNELEAIGEWLCDEKAQRKGFANYEEFADAVTAKFFKKEVS